LAAAEAGPAVMVAVAEEEAVEPDRAAVEAAVVVAGDRTCRRVPVVVAVEQHPVRTFPGPAAAGVVAEEIIRAPAWGMSVGRILLISHGPRGRMSHGLISRGLTSHDPEAAAGLRSATCIHRAAVPARGLRFRIVPRRELRAPIRVSTDRVWGISPDRRYPVVPISGTEAAIDLSDRRCPAVRMLAAAARGPHFRVGPTREEALDRSGPRCPGDLISAAEIAPNAPRFPVVRSGQTSVAVIGPSDRHCRDVPAVMATGPRGPTDRSLAGAEIGPLFQEDRAMEIDLDALVTVIDLDALVMVTDRAALAMAIDLDALAMATDLDVLVTATDLDVLVTVTDRDALVMVIVLGALVMATVPAGLTGTTGRSSAAATGRTVPIARGSTTTTSTSATTSISTTTGTTGA
jgi:hypothetical protein